MNRLGATMEADLDLVRELIRRYGLDTLNHMVHVAAASSSTFRRGSPSRFVSPADGAPPDRDSLVSSSGHSILSSATSASHATSSNLSFYTDPGSVGRGPGSRQQWPAVGLAPGPGVSGTSTPVDSYEKWPFGHSPGPASYSEVGQLEAEPAGDGSRTKLQCPFCFEFGADMRIGRKPDLKRHFQKIHATNAQWVCKLNGGCNLSFDFHTAYDAHVKQDHGGLKDPDAKVNVCQQVVFACGFERCREVFEAATDHDGPAVMNGYFDHVLAHVAGPNGDRWSYSRRMRNLLHQQLVGAAWKACGRDAGRELFWQPQSSNVLRKMLECRHIVEVDMLCRYAVLLGSNRLAPAIAPAGFETPVLNTCRLINPCHDPRGDPRFAQGPVRFNKKPRRRAADELPAGAAPPVLRSSPSASVFTSYSDSKDPFCAEVLDPTAAALAPPGPDFHAGHPAPTSHPGHTSHPAGFALDGADEMVMPDFHPGPHPLHLYAAFQSLGRPPSQEQVIMDMDEALGVHGVLKQEKPAARRNVLSRKSLEKMRTRRTSSPEAPGRLGEEPPPLPVVPSQQLGRRRSSGAMDTDFYQVGMPH